MIPDSSPMRPMIVERDSATGAVKRQYIEGRLLGKGGFAKCYQVTDCATKEELAAKVIDKASLSKPKTKQKLISEIQIHSTMKHPNIVQYKHYFEDDHCVYIMLELCTEHTLMEHSKRKRRFTEVETSYLMHQCIRGVRYMHDNFVIHRDLKLGNLLLNNKMELKIADFGLATQLDYDGERKQTMCGTPNYIAPEILKGGNRGHSFEVDVWSLGVIMYTLLVGKPPFEMADIKSTYNRIRQVSYSFPPDLAISSEARNLVRRILQAEPERRPNLAGIEADSFFVLHPPPALAPLSLFQPGTANYYAHERRLADMEATNPSAHAHRVHLSRSPMVHHRLETGGYRSGSQPRGAAYTPSGAQQAANPGYLSSGARSSTEWSPGYRGSSVPASSRSPSGSRGGLREGLAPPVLQGGRAASGVRGLGVAASPPHHHHYPSSVQSYKQGGVYSSSPKRSSSQSMSPRRAEYARRGKVAPPQTPDYSAPAAPAASSRSPSSTSPSYRAYAWHASGSPAQESPPVPLHRASSQVPVNPASTPVPVLYSPSHGLPTPAAHVSSPTPLPSRVVQPSPSAATAAYAERPSPVAAAAAYTERPSPAAAAAAAAAAYAERPSPAATAAAAAAAAYAPPAPSDREDDEDRANLTTMHEVLEKTITQGRGAALEQAEAFELREEPQETSVTCYADFTSKYGLAYLLNNGNVGVSYNDSTKMVWHVDTNTVQYVSRGRSTDPSVAPAEEKLYCTIDEYPDSLRKKITLITYFKNYLTRSRGGPKDGSPEVVPCGKGKAQVGSSDADLVYIKRWLKTKYAIIFRLSNKSVQVSFFDGTEILLFSEARQVTYTDELGNSSTFPLSSMMLHPKPEISQRLRYTKEIICRLINKS